MSKNVESAKHYNLATLYMKNNEFYKAEEEYKKVIEINAYGPSLLRAYQHLGMLHEQQSRFNEAKEQYQKVIELAPNNGYGDILLANVHARLAYLYENEGDIVRAENEFIESIKKEPDDLAVRKDFAAFYVIHKRFDEAKSEMQKVTSMAPNDISAHYFLFGLYIQDLEYSRAEEECNKIIAINSNADEADCFTILSSKIGEQEHHKHLEL
jgi:tetratricopeptide (TPR) repeat protein